MWINLDELKINDEPDKSKIIDEQKIEFVEN